MRIAGQQAEYLPVPMDGIGNGRQMAGVFRHHWVQYREQCQPGPASRTGMPRRVSDMVKPLAVGLEVPNAAAA